MEEILWEKLRELIADSIGFRIRQQDLQYFQEKIRKRITQLKLSNLKEYYHLLHEVNIPKNNLSPQQKLLAEKEWKTLASTITNGESFFFRDRGQFNLLANQILPEIIASKREAKQKGELSYLSLKIWSAGCSTGEEVYSLAMLISELIPDPEQWHIIIIGTDINQDFLNLARRGIYKQWSFRLTDPLFKTKYFIADKDSWQVKPYLKSWINFYQDNLVNVETISHHNYGLDLVLCRNVFIYFDTDSIAKAIQKIASTLRPGGYLISGHAELQALQLNNFQLISFPESIVYQYLANNQEIKSLLPKNYDEQNFADINSFLIEPDNILIDLNLPNTPQISLAQNNDFSSSLELISHSVNNAPSPTDSIQLNLQEIETLFKQNQYDRVIEQAEKLIQDNSDLKEIYYLIAQAHANQNNLEEAIKNCDRALEIDSIYIEPLYLLAQIAEAQNNYRRIKELLKRIIYLEPKSINAYIDLGAIYSKEKDLKRSQKMYQTAYELLKASPENIKINYQGQTNINQLLTYIKQKL